MPHKHTAVQDKDGVYALHRDGRICFCPKLMYPQIVPYQKTQVSPVEYVTNLHRLPCTTDCPFAQVRKMTPKELGWPNGVDTEVIDIYEISCEGGVREITLDEVTQFEKPAAVSPLLVVK